MALTQTGGNNCSQSLLADVEPVSQQSIEVGKMLGGLIKARSRFSANVTLVIVGVLIGVTSSLLL